MPAVVGCVSSVGEQLPGRLAQASPPLRPARIDVEASEVDVRVEPGESLNPGTDTRDLRQQVADALQPMLENPTGGPPVPARFRLRGHAEGSTSVILQDAPPFSIFSALGTPIGSGSADVTLELQVGDQKYVSTAKESVVAGDFYNAAPGYSALAQAIATAMADIVRQAQEKAK